MKDHEELRLSKSGFSIRTGWGDEKRIVASCPVSYNKVSEKPELYKQWLVDAEQLINAYNNQ